MTPRTQYYLKAEGVFPTVVITIFYSCWGPLVFWHEKDELKVIKKATAVPGGNEILISLKNAMHERDVGESYVRI